MHPIIERRAEARDNLDHLPPVAFAVLPGRDQLIQLRRGQCGYYPVTATRGDLTLEQHAERLNAELGVTADQAEAMLIGSMFGWHVPAANPVELARMREART